MRPAALLIAVNPGRAAPRRLHRMRVTRVPSLAEEIANGATHGLGAILSVAGLTLLVTLAAPHGGVHLASALVFGLALLLLYTASALYHLIPAPRAKHALKVVDHAAIYLLIAGTYTPFTLITLRDSGGRWLFWVIWGLAALGVACEAAWVHRPQWLSALIYVAMGWLVVLLVRPLSQHLPAGGLWLLFAGGVAYTVGTLFYVLHWVPFMHSVWHLFVLGGSVCHFLAVATYVVRA